MTTSKSKISQVSYESPKKIVKDFEQYWEASLKPNNVLWSQKNIIEEQSVQLRLKANDFDNHVVQFQEFLQKISIYSAIKAWLESKLADPQWKEHYFDRISRLSQKNLIPLVDNRGNLVTLEYFIEHGHQDILENIRSVQEWTMLEKEEIVQCYIAFSQSLARQTHNLVPYGVDPDRERVSQKAVSYEIFIDFIPHLSERDALIAKLLYFGDIAMEEILTLKRNALDTKNFSIQLSGNPIQLPRHLFLELLNFINSSNSSQQLVFTNVRGAQVDRTHLNQSFSRACEKTIKKTKITPGALLKLKSEREDLNS